MDGLKLREVCQATCPPRNQPSSGMDWKYHLQQVNLKAIQYVDTALKRFSAFQTKLPMTTWFGMNSYYNTEVRNEVKRVLNSISDMLGKVEFIYPGPLCKSNTYAYVLQRGHTCSSSQLQSMHCTKNDKGQFLIYLCDIFWRRPLNEQIETLAHEGSHHATAYTEDVVDIYGNNAYGRSSCRLLAFQQPGRALRNADNFCYYIQDITDHSQLLGPPLSELPPAPPQPQAVEEQAEAAKEKKGLLGSIRAIFIGDD